MARIVSKRLKRARSETPSPTIKLRQSADHIPRPPNAFILFRKDLNAKAKARGETHQKAVSGAACELWAQYKAEESSEYQFWNEEAERVKKEHLAKYPDYAYKPRKRTTEKKKRRSRQDADVDAEQKAMVLAAACGGPGVIGSPVSYVNGGLAPYSPTSTISWASSPGRKSSHSPTSSGSSKSLSSPPITPPTRVRRLTRASAKKASARHKMEEVAAATPVLPLNTHTASPTGVMLTKDSSDLHQPPSLTNSPISPYLALPTSPYTPEYAYDQLPTVGDALGMLGIHPPQSAYLTPIDYTGDAAEVHAQFTSFSLNLQLQDIQDGPQLHMQASMPATYISQTVSEMPCAGLTYGLPPPVELPARYEMALKPNAQDEYLLSYLKDTCYDQSDVMYFYH